MRKRELLAVAVGDSYRVDLESARHRWVLDERREEGGTDGGPSPVEAMLGALVSCLTISFQYTARRSNVPVARIEGWVAANENRYIEEIAVELQVWSAADEATVRALLPRAERGCFVKALLRPDLTLSVDLVVMPASDAPKE